MIYSFTKPLNTSHQNFAKTSAQCKPPKLHYDLDEWFIVSPNRATQVTKLRNDLKQNTLSTNCLRALQNGTTQFNLLTQVLVFGFIIFWLQQMIILYNQQ